MAYTRIHQAHAEDREAENLGPLQLYSTISDPTTSGTQKFTGGYAYSWTSTSTAGRGISITPTTDLRANYFTFHPDPIIVNDAPVLYAWLTPTSRDYVEWDANTGLLRLVVNSVVVDSVLASTTGIDISSLWHQIGIVLHADAATGWISFYVNGSLALSYAGNTSTSISEIYVIGAQSAGTGIIGYLDDYYVDDSTGESDVLPPGKRFLPSIPDGNGTDSDWTNSGGDSINNYTFVDEISSDGDTTYVGVGADAQRDGYTTGDIVLPLFYTITAVIPMLAAKRTDTGTDTQVKPYAYDGVIYDPLTPTSLGTDYEWYTWRTETQPDASAWNLADFNAMEFGIESDGVF